MRLVPKNQGGNVLNTLGGYWKNLSDWFDTKQQGTALDEMGHPIMQANGELAKTYFSPKQEVAAATIATLPATVMSMGFPAFVGGVGEAYIGSSIGGPVGASTIESLGGNEDAQQMGYDIGELLGGYAGFMRGRGIQNYSKNKLYSWHSPEKDSDIPYTTPKRRIHQYNNRTGAHNNPEIERIRHEIEAGYPEPTGKPKVKRTRKPKEPGWGIIKTEEQLVKENPMQKVDIKGMTSGQIVEARNKATRDYNQFIKKLYYEQYPEPDRRSKIWEALDNALERKKITQQEYDNFMNGIGLSKHFTFLPDDYFVRK